MRRVALLAVGAVALLAATTAAGRSTATKPTPRPMLVGFQDEASFLWSSSRFENLDRAAQGHARILRVTASWRSLAPTKPATPTNPNDPAYRFDGLDDFVYHSQLRGMYVLLTIADTPTWASASHKTNAAPAPAALGAFCRAIATRYNGRNGQPFVGYYSVWNEPNLDQFLHPQFSASGVSVAPRLYAGMARACYAGIKGANPSAKVALGETSPRGRDKPKAGTQAAHSPGKFMQLVARARPQVRFDAWAHHPYPTGFAGKPVGKFRWPNVGIGDLPRLELELKKAFHRSSVPIWVTEFAEQTRPERRGALSYAQQAAYLTQAVNAVAAVPQTQMFIWYVFRDTQQQRWQSGVIQRSGTPKPAYAAFSRVASFYDVGNPTMVIAARPNPVVSISLLEFRPYVLPEDPPIGMTYRVFDARNQLVAVAQPTIQLDPFGYFKVPLTFTPARRTAYTVTFDLNDFHGNTARRVAHLVTR
jgi:Cellulase (glycosyl hydrolase family 5)